MYKLRIENHAGYSWFATFTNLEDAYTRMFALRNDKTKSLELFQRIDQWTIGDTDVQMPEVSEGVQKPSRAEGTPGTDA